MSFLRNIRNNLSNSGAGTNGPGYRSDKSKPTRSVISERNAVNNSSRRTGGNVESERYGSGIYSTGGGRRDSTTSRREGNSSAATLRRDSSKYGKENPAPIIVYVDKYETVKKKPAGILRKNTFTKGDHLREEEDDRRESGGNAIARSDTFTINEPEEEKKKTSTYTKKKNKEKSPENVFDPLYSKNIELDSQDKLPVVVDSRTYRKKSLKSSKPVQKVESFIKRVENKLFRHDSKKNVRKDSNSSDGTYVPQFRDIGINCKLDEEEKLKSLKKRSRSKDSMLDTGHPELSSSSQKSYRERSSTPRARSVSPTKKYSTYDRRDHRYSHEESPVPPERTRRGRERSSSPFETLELKSNSADSSYLKARQKEMELGYSTVNKKPSTLTRARSPDRNKSILVNTTRTERFDPDRGRTYTTVTTHSTHRVEFDRPPPQFYSDTYNTLKEEYEQANRKPVGIASPRLNTPKQHELRPHSPSKTTVRKDSAAELPKYTFGTNQLQERRSRFQEFQKSFKKIDDKSAEATYQQSFFVPI